MVYHKSPPASPESSTGKMCGWSSRAVSVDLAEETLGS